MPSSLSLIFAALACFHLTAESPVYKKSFNTNLEIRNTHNCTSLTADPSTVCWDELDISDYLAGWNQTTPTCEAIGDDGVDCCLVYEPWTTCFLRMAYGTAGTDCTTINPQSCTLIPLSSSLDAGIQPKVKYVVQNIVAINSLFILNYQAMRYQSTNIGGSGSAVSTLHQILGGNTELGTTLNNGNVAKALVVGLPFWGTTSVLASGPQQINSQIDSPTAQDFAQSLRDTKTVSSLLFAIPYDINDYITTAIQLGSGLNQAENLLQSALGLIMNDMSTFSSWAAHGLYSGPTTSFTVSQVAVGMTSAFTTYLVGEALSQFHFSSTPASTTMTKEAFQQSRTCTKPGDVCKDSNGKTYYWSQAFQTQYEINEPKNWTVTSPGSQQPVIQQLGYEASAYGLLEYIETTDAYMPVLFDGAYNCTLEGKAGGSAVNVNADGSLDIACLSALPIYLSKGSSCPTGAVLVERKCPFGYIG